MDRILCEKILLAIKYIESKNNSRIRPYIRTIRSFLAGVKKSEHYDSFYSLHKDVCGKYPYASTDEIYSALKELENKGIIQSKISSSGKIGFYLVHKQKVNSKIKKDNNNVSEDEQNNDCTINQSFYEKANKREKLLLTKFRKQISELLPDYEIKDNKLTYGFSQINYDGEYAKKICWVSRDKSTNQLVIKYREKIDSKEMVLPYCTNKETKEAFRNLRLCYCKDSSYIESIKQRIMNNAPFSELQVDYLKDIKFMSHQKAGIELSNKFERFAFFYDKGIGKTIMALGIMMEKYVQSHTKFLVVTSKTKIREAWLRDSDYFKDMRIMPIGKKIENEYLANLFDCWFERDGGERFFTDDKGNIVKEFSNRTYKEEIIPDMYQLADHYITDFDSIPYGKKLDVLLARLNCSGLIIDDIVFFENGQLKNNSKMHLLSRKMKYVYLISEIPTHNSSVEYYRQMRIIDPNTFNMSFASFKDMFLKHIGYGSYIDKNERTKNEVDKMVANRSIAIKREDCIFQHKEAHRIIDIDLDTDTRSIYSLKCGCITYGKYFVNLNETDISSVMRTPSITKLREVASCFYIDDFGNTQVNTSKYSEIIKLIGEIGYSKDGKKNRIVILSSFSLEIKMLSDEFNKRGYRAVPVCNESKNIEKLFLSFQYGKTEILIVDPSTIKSDIDLTSCHYCVISSMPSSKEDYKKAYDAIFKYDQNNYCIFYHLISAKTIEENIYDMIINGTDETNILSIYNKKE